MIIRRTLAALVLCTLANPAVATRQDDARFLVQTFVSAEGVEKIRLHVAKVVVALFAETLKEKSVRINDADRFAALLPDQITTPLVDVILRHGREKCFAQFTPEDLAYVADFFRANPDWETTSAKDFGDPRYTLPLKAQLQFGMCLTFAASGLKHHMKQAGVKLRPEHMPIFADTLVQQGIASFPNRVLRDSIISDIRQSGQ